MSISADRSPQPGCRALLSVHDVAPDSLAFLADLLRDLSALRVPAVNLAIVPFFHGRGTWTSQEVRRVASAVPPGIRTEVLLHGCYHRRVGANARLPAWRRLLSSIQSAGEDEFFGLPERDTAERVRGGRDAVAAAFGRVPAAFVPPAWSGGPPLRAALKGLGFSLAEDHLWLYEVQRDRRLFAPVIAFATRSPWREWLSARWARAVMRAPARGRLLRFAFHPADYRSPSVRACALGLVEALGRTHEWTLYSELVAPGTRRG